MPLEGELVGEVWFQDLTSRLLGGQGGSLGEVWHPHQALLGRPDPWQHLCPATRGGVFLGSCRHGCVAGLHSCDTGS